MKLKKKYLDGVAHKGIRRRKGDDQPGKAVKRLNDRIDVIPARGRKYRQPQQPAGFPRGRGK